MSYHIAILKFTNVFLLHISYSLCITEAVIKSLVQRDIKTITIFVIVVFNSLIRRMFFFQINKAKLFWSQNIFFIVGLCIV